MPNPIYFSKIEFKEYLGYKHRSTILVNLVSGELSYQVFNQKREMPAIQGIEFEELYGKEYSYDINFPARIISNDKTNFEPKVFKNEHYEQEVIFSYGIKLSNKQLEKLLPYCNALDFEPYRNREMSMEDEGNVGYRDEVQMEFKAISDSHLPIIELPMDYFYDKKHIWPSEKLYRYLLKTFFEKNKKTKDWITAYRAHSLFF